MSLTVHILYQGENGSAAAYARELTESGTVALIRDEPGCLGYDFYQSLEDPEKVLLVEQMEDQDALDTHHGSPMMDKIIELRAKYGLKMDVRRFVSPGHDQRYLR